MKNVNDVIVNLESKKTNSILIAFFVRYTPCGTDYLACVHEIGISNKRLDEIASNILSNCKDAHLVWGLHIPLNKGFSYNSKKDAFKVWYK